MTGSVPRGLFIAGTDTGVGKSRIGAALARLLTQRGWIVRPRKPVESGCRRVFGRLIAEDARLLQAAAGSSESLERICPYPFEPALSPERAAALDNVSLSLERLREACLEGVEESDFLLVEGAGGFYSPLAPGVLNADLAAALPLPVLLVAADRLGTINHTLLAVEAIERRSLALEAVVLNQIDPEAIDPGMDNSADLSRWLGRPVVVTGRFHSRLEDSERITLDTALIPIADRLCRPQNA